MDNKMAAGSLAGSLVMVGLWVLNLTNPNIEVTPEVASAFTVIVGAVGAWITPKRMAPRRKRAAGARQQLQAQITHEPPAAAIPPVTIPPVTVPHVGTSTATPAGQRGP